MNEEELRQAILAAPDDDEPRLMFADQMVERGDPRGEFIQLQIALANDPDQPELMKRADELLERWRQTWRNPYRGGRSPDLVYRRGFVWEAHFNEDLFAAEPVESMLETTLDVGDDVLARMRKIEIRGEVAGARFREAVTDGRLAKLRALVVHEPGADLLDVLPRSAIEEVKVERHSVAPISAEAFRDLPSLRSIFVEDVELDWLLGVAPERLVSVGTQPAKIGRAARMIKTDGLLAVLERLVALRRLDLQGQLDASGVEALASWPGLRSITHLGIDIAAIDRIAASPNATALVDLTVGKAVESERLQSFVEGRIEDDLQLADAPFSRCLEKLVVGVWPRLSPASFRPGAFPKLRVLSLPVAASADQIEMIMEAAPRLGRLSIRARDDDARDLLGRYFPVYTVVKPRELPATWVKYYPK
jgi:uncharacterized protein (TIGR02996 family)